MYLARSFSLIKTCKFSSSNTRPSRPGIMVDRVLLVGIQRHGMTPWLSPGASYLRISNFQFLSHSHTVALLTIRRFGCQKRPQERPQRCNGSDIIVQRWASPANVIKEHPAQSF